MSGFELPEDTKEWAQKQGIVHRCPKHHILHDAHIECPECRKEKRPDIFKNVVWPESLK